MPGEFGHKFQKNAHVGWTGTNGYHYTNDFDPKLLKEKGEVRRSRVALAKRCPYFDDDSRLRTCSTKLIRTMMPFTFRCEKCEHFHYVGTKFDAIIYEVEEEKYLNKISIWRLQYRCCYCRNIIAFKTDPKNARYVMEYGGKVTASTQVGEVIHRKEKSQEEDDRDALAMLEDRANSLTLAMEEQEALEDLRADRLKRADTVTAVATVLDDMWGKRESKSKKRERQENEIDLSDEVVADLFRDKAQSLASVPQLSTTIGKQPVLKKMKVVVKPKTSVGLCLDYPSDSD